MSKEFEAASEHYLRTIEMMDKMLKTDEAFLALLDAMKNIK